MLIRKIQKIKESHMVVIPSQFCQSMGLNSEMTMSIEMKNNNIVMTPVQADQAQTGASQD
jgi:antitoxin component of MazEF toxin-antitoxin module